MEKTSELQAFEMVVNERMMPEIPIDAAHVQLEAVPLGFIQAASAFVQDQICRSDGANKASEATSEPAPGAASSAPQG